MNGWHLYAITAIILLVGIRHLTWTKALAVLAWPLLAFTATLLLVLTSGANLRYGGQHEDPSATGRVSR